MANTSVPVMARSLEGILALPNRIVPFLVPQSAKAIAATTEAANLALIGAERGRAGSTGGVSLYMGAGGTNFGFQAGANLAGRAFEPALTSYDYDCPIGEDGESFFPFSFSVDGRRSRLVISETGKEAHCLLLFSVSSFLTGHTGQRGIGGDGNKFEAIRAALLAAAEADAVAAGARLEAAEAEAKSTAKHGRDGEVAAASASSSSSSSSSTSASPSSAQQQQQRQQQQRLKSLRKGAERAAADARFPDLPPPPPVVAFAAVRLSLVGDLLSDGVLGSLAGAGGGGVLVRFNSTTRGSASGWSSGGIGAVAVRGPALPAMEALGQASGLVLYRASVPRAALLAAAASAAASPAPAASAPAASASAAFAPRHHASSVLDLGSTVHDYGGVYLDGVPVAALDRAAFSTSVLIPRLPALSLRSSSSGKGKKGAGGGNDGGGNVTLDILVHEMGRVNFGCVTLDHKGLETDAVTLDGKTRERGEVFLSFFPLGSEIRARDGGRERVFRPPPFPSNRVSKSNHSRENRLFFGPVVFLHFRWVEGRGGGEELERNERDHGVLFSSSLTRTAPPETPFSSAAPPCPAPPSASQPAPRTPGRPSATRGPRPPPRPCRRRIPPPPRRRSARPKLPACLRGRRGRRLRCKGPQPSRHRSASGACPFFVGGEFVCFGGGGLREREREG
jgi:hypothetical protein